MGKAESDTDPTGRNVVEGGGPDCTASGSRVPSDQNVELPILQEENVGEGAKSSGNKEIGGIGTVLFADTFVALCKFQDEQGTRLRAVTGDLGSVSRGAGYPFFGRSRMKMSTSSSGIV
ncbi:hypothetical protein M5K25_010818 [Dendrobium thyrsiflorum]|uniref:Uncharacterized protein n=1 Tax=Dendrobium thyrsiflorum TaxID=117978 RepID=A0ABD0V0M8_DENTH